MDEKNFCLFRAVNNQVEKRGEVDDVLDCVCLFHHCRNTHRHCSFLFSFSLSLSLSLSLSFPLSLRFPFYFELKIAFVIWLLSPYTKGSSVLYRKFVHPTLSNKEKEIDEYITQARDKSYETMMRVGKRGLNLAANAAVTAAAKGQGVLSEKLRSFSMQDLTLIRDEDTVHLKSHEPQLHPPRASLLETIEDSASCYSSGEESSVAQRSNGTLTETRTDPSDEDAGDKLPKRTQSLKAPKKITKAELPVKSVKARPRKKAAGSLASGESS
ncbi:receptor expression-enhancing protein 2 isoform X3 [Oxyura jamaicensis]|uniref:receptor expression-enhancing protein 2 isoform X3 n=1 Tax=Oxyura jamaicensis TaxID=8884 RepID=UPI0015A67C60|nr:receptor expression-enhancing protein 2 isoform X3 [Oxyura jamaicensis]